jgi:EmrB/QacA subfamily drug resistance transporter
MTRAPRALIATVSVGALVTVLSATIVNVAIPTLGRDLGASLLEVQWVATAYLLSLTAVIPLAGWASERFGTRRVWLGSLTAFLCGSVLCGLAWSAESLIAARVLQGLGGGLVLPVAQAIVVRRSDPRRIGEVLAVIALVNLSGPTLGPVLGGLLVGEVSWRWLFLINVPLCLVPLALGLRIVPHEEGLPGRRLDVRGLLLLPPGLALLTYGLARSAAGGGVDPAAIGTLAAGVALVAAFVLHARGLGRDALLDLGLLADRGFRACATMAASFGALMFGMLFLLPLYWEAVRGRTPLEAGLLMVPQGIGSLISLLVVGRLADRHGSRIVVLVGLVIASLATIPFVFADESTPVAPLLAALVLRGMGLSAVLTPANAAAFRGLSREAVPYATSLLTVLLRVGGSLGVAVVAAVLQSRVGAALPGTTPEEQIDLLHRGAGEVAATVAPAFGVTAAVLLALTVVTIWPARWVPRRQEVVATAPAEPAGRARR